jgi:mono/diheme cytochrome c family protein
LKTLQTGLCLSLGLSSSQAASDAEVMKRGKELYEEPGSCVTCHMADGKGQPGSIPPLAGSTWLQDPNRTIAITLRGLVGPIKVNNRRYYSAMPPQLLFDDEKLADIITYVNQTWGNKVSAVTAEQVGKARAHEPVFTCNDGPGVGFLEKNLHLLP